MANKPTRRLSWIAVLLLVSLVCTVAYFLANQIVNARMPRLSNAISVPARSNQYIEALGNGMIYYDGSSLHALDGRGRQIWSYACGSLADYSVSDGGVATWTGTMLSLLPPGSGTALYSGNQEKAILDARLGKSFAAVQLGEEHNSTMLILDTNGRQIDKIELPNQTVLDFGFFRNGSLLWVMSLDTEGTALLGTINTYKPGKMLAGTIEDDTQLIYDVSFQSAKVRVVGLNDIRDYDYIRDEIRDNRILVYGWKMVATDKSQADPLMVFVPIAQAEGAGITDLRVIQGQDDQSIRLPGTASQVFARGETIYAFAQDRVMVVNLRSPEPVVYQLPVLIDRVVALTDNHSAIVTSGSAVYMIPPP